ncbi:hypothetical protein FG386_002023 [Cryptosporidium ryanae]|uniref:uncharacterized protein n=1 Tax=Cryptosporidium ryanae TaxID=515981 RepID=UPI003519EC31|nr:hypothetical protein FG386_002023 [Cryptosporidium ryanae]
MIRIVFLISLVFHSLLNVCFCKTIKLEQNSIIEIIPDRSYYGVEVNVDKSYIIKINTKYLTNSRYQLECYSSGPDPQGEFIIKPFTQDGESNIKLGKQKLILNKILPNSIFYFKDGFYTSKLFKCKISSKIKEKLNYVDNKNETYIIFEMSLKVKGVTYSEIIELKPILVSLELEHLKYGLPKSFYQVAGSLVLTLVLTLLVFSLSVRYGLVEKGSNFIFSDKSKEKTD